MEVLPDDRFVKRIGVFICRCGKNISSTVDTTQLVELSAALPGVVWVEENTYTCSSEGISSIMDKVKSKRLRRVVVASCTPRTHETVFRQSLERAGISKYLFELVNIREGCSWIHPDDREVATRKAFDLISMGVAKAYHLYPLEDITSPVMRQALVIGGGVSGMSSAFELASTGIRVHLVESSNSLGGFFAKVSSTVFGSQLDGKAYIEKLTRKIQETGLVNIYTSSRVVSVKGGAGSFDVVVETGSGSESRQFTVGGIIVATGGQYFQPPERADSSRVISSLDLEKMLRGALTPKGRIVIVNCAAIRWLGGNYCGRICCVIGAKQAVKIIRASGGAVEAVIVVGRDQMMWGEEAERLYHEALEAGVRFVRFSDEHPPEVIVDDGGDVVVDVLNSASGERERLKADWVVMNYPIVSSRENVELGKILKIAVEEDGFFRQKHPKLGPVEFSTSSIYLCGSCRFPALAHECSAQASACAFKLGALIRKGEMRLEPYTAFVDEELCSGCGICTNVCCYEAISVKEVYLNGRRKRVASVGVSLCKGCGACASACPSGAMDQNVFTDEQIVAMIKALSRRVRRHERKMRPVILTFACNWCSYAGADLAGISRLHLRHNVRLLRVMCSGRVRPEWILLALGSGIDGVCVLGCHPGQCHYEEGNYRARRRMKALRRLLKMTGFDVRRVRIDWVSASEAGRFKKIIDEMVDQLLSIEGEHAEVDLEQGA